MIGNKLEQSIIAVFQDNLSSTFSINELSKSLRKAYPNINRKSNFFLKEGILKKITIGNSYQCFLNLESEKTRTFMAVNELNRLDTFLEKNPRFQGSYAQLLDIGCRFNIQSIFYKDNELFIVLGNMSEKNMLDASGEMHDLKKGHEIKFFDKAGFQQYFLQDTRFQQNHIVVYNVYTYLRIISELGEKLFMNGLLNHNPASANHNSGKTLNKKHLMVHQGNGSR